MLGKVNVARRVWFAVRTGSGAARTGLTGANITITVRNPGDTASSSPAPVEVGAGLYYFDIPAAFSLAHGAGTYGYLVAVTTAPLDLLAGEVDFYAVDLDDLPTAAEAATAVWSEPLPGAFGAGEAGERLATSDDTIGTNLDATVSSRSDFDETTDPVELLDAGGAAGTSAAELVVDVEANLAAAHGAGQWDAVGSVPAIVAGVWGEALPGAFGAGTAGERLATTDDTVGTNLDATVSSRSSHSAADVDTTLTASHGAGAWTTAPTPPSVAAIVAGVWGEALPGAFGVGEAGERLATTDDRVDVAVSSRSSHSAGDVDTTLTAAHGAGSWNGTTPAAVATAVWSEALPGAFGVGEAGERLAATDDLVGTNLDAAVSTRSSHSAADVDTVLTAAHGAGAWDATATEADRIEVSVIATTGTPATVRVLAALFRSGVQITAGIVSGTFTLHDPDGTVVTGPTALVVEANGFLSLEVAGVTLVDVRNYYATIAITDGTGTVTGRDINPTIGG